MRVLALDFDGVLFDSARESFAVAIRTYRELRPGSALAARDERELYHGFLALMPLGNGAQDYGVALALLDQGRVPADQQAYDRLRADQDAAWLEQYRRRFYEARRAWADRAPREWCASILPYPGIADALRRRRDRAAYAIATSKDRHSVDLLLEAYRLADLFPAERIVDRAAGPDKRIHLECLRERLACRYEEMTFVDDKVNHLDSVAPLGVRCALAAWGYNGPREHDLAAARGYVVCTLEGLDGALFGHG